MSNTDTVLLVRHGEVSNPNHVVYGDLPGFHLSASGVLQAHATGRHLASFEVDIVLTSPIQRAVETATAIARRHGLDPVVDKRLTESGQFPHWTGNRWEELAELFPGELDGYLSNAENAGGRESPSDVADRYAAVIAAAASDGHSVIVLVGHQDPIQACRLKLTGRELHELRTDPSDHGEVITLSGSNDVGWVETSRWKPAQPTG